MFKRKKYLKIWPAKGRYLGDFTVKMLIFQLIMKMHLSVSLQREQLKGSTKNFFLDNSFNNLNCYLYVTHFGYQF